MRNSEIFVGFLGERGSTAALQKVASPVATRKLNAAHAVAVAEVSALPDGLAKAAMTRRLDDLAVAIRATELRLLSGNAPPAKKGQRK